MLLGFIHARKKKFKFGLKAIYAAQTIVSELDETVERNLDYLMAVNTLTAFMLLSIQKPVEALEFILIAERCCMKLIEKNKRKGGSPFGAISEDGGVVQDSAGLQKGMWTD